MKPEKIKLRKKRRKLLPVFTALFAFIFTQSTAEATNLNERGYCCIDTNAVHKNKKEINSGKKGGTNSLKFEKLGKEKPKEYLLNKNKIDPEPDNSEKEANKKNETKKNTKIKPKSIGLIRLKPVIKKNNKRQLYILPFVLPDLNKLYY